MKAISITLSLYAFALLLSTCKKKDDALPEARKGGPVIFACKINGESYVAKTEETFSGTIKGVDGGWTEAYEPYVRGNMIDLSTHSSQGDFFLHVFQVDSIGIYFFNQDPRCLMPGCLDIPQNYVSYHNQYRTSPNANGWIRLSYATPPEIVATFAFKMQDKNGNILEVTDGRLHQKQGQ